MTLPGRTERIFAHGVKSVEKFCGLPTGTAAGYNVQLGKSHVELLEQLSRSQPHRTGASLSERWGETFKRFLAYAKSGEEVWLNAIRSYRHEKSEITLAACLTLGYDRPGEGCLNAVHLQARAKPGTEDPFRAWGVEAIGQLEPGDGLDGSGQNPVVGGADVLIGFRELDRVKEHLQSGWRITRAQAPKEYEQPSKWHLRVYKTSGNKVHLKVYRGAGIKKSEITHEAAARAGFRQGSVYQINVMRTKTEVSSFHAHRVSFIRHVGTKGAWGKKLP
jgi:hypothetical protein